MYSYYTYDNDYVDSFCTKVSHILYHDYNMDVSSVHIMKLIYVYINGIINFLEDIYTEKLSEEYKYKYMYVPINDKIIISLNLETRDIEMEYNYIDINKYIDDGYAVQIENQLVAQYFRMVLGEKYGGKFYDKTSMYTMLNVIFYHLLEEDDEMIEYIIKWTTLDN